jgi:hypothetical protein
MAQWGPDFTAAALVFEGVTFEFDDPRRNYSEKRIVGFGGLAGRIVVAGYAQCGTDR